MGDANCPECGGGYTCQDQVADREVVTATCRDCQTEFEVEAEVTINFNMA